MNVCVMHIGEKHSQVPGPAREPGGELHLQNSKLRCVVCVIHIIDVANSEMQFPTWLASRAGDWTANLGRG